MDLMWSKYIHTRTQQTSGSFYFSCKILQEINIYELYIRSINIKFDLNRFTVQEHVIHCNVTSHFFFFSNAHKTSLGTFLWDFAGTHV